MAIQRAEADDYQTLAQIQNDAAQVFAAQELTRLGWWGLDSLVRRLSATRTPRGVMLRLKATKASLDARSRRMNQK